MTTNVSVEGAILDTVAKAADSISLQTLGSMIDTLKGESALAWSEIRRTWVERARRIGFHLSNPPLFQSIESSI